ncbi:MAG: hypothetical protein LCH96_03200 [Actinobacteria bacterium]|nr:hypothetical protein [Actinomycetota bacterium]
MADDFDDLRDLGGLRTSLKLAADDFRPSFDASAMAEAGRARSRRRTIIGGIVSTLAVVVAAMLVVPTLLRPPATLPAAPAPPSAPGTGVAQTFDPMTAPVPGAVAPDGFWRTTTVATANLKVSYPADWTESEDQWGVLRITAPSGYFLELRTDALQSTCDDGADSVDGRIARTDLSATTSLGKGAVVVRWHNGGSSPVSLNLAQHSRTGSCWQRFLNFAGVDDVYLGSGDNAANPTPHELDQAVAILLGATLLH